MRSVILICILVVFGGRAGVAQEASLEEVLDRYYRAVGGVEAWRAVRSLRATGLVEDAQRVGFQTPITRVYERPSRMRVESSFQGMPTIQATDGTTAWLLLPHMRPEGAVALSGAEAARIHREADFEGPLIGWREKGHRLELVGREDDGGAPAYRIRVELADGDVQELLLDAESYLPRRLESRIETRGKGARLENVYGDYRKVDGLTIAHSTEIRTLGWPTSQKLTLDTVELNVEIPEGYFSKPEPVAAGEGPSGDGG